MTRIEKKPQKRSIQTRNTIIRTTEKLITQHGFDETNTNMIAKEANISVGSIYTHFKDKYEIFLIILEEYREKTLTFAQTNIEKVLSGEEDLKKVLKWAIPALYDVNRINGKLSYELERFVLVDRRAAGIDERYEEAEEELLQKLLNHYKENLRVSDIEATATLINLQLRIVFRYLLHNHGKIDETVILTSFIEMLSHSIR